MPQETRLVTADELFRMPDDPYHPLRAGSTAVADDVAARQPAWSPRDPQYLSLGVQEVWLVEPALRRVTVHRVGEEAQVLHESDTRDGGSLLPGFRYSLTRLFSSEI